VLIDLDAPPTTEIRRRRAAKRPAAKWKALVAAALLLLLGGAAAPWRGGIVQVASTGGRPADSSLITGDALYALIRAPGSTGESEMRAYPLRPGGPSWAVRVSSSRGQILLGPGGGTVVVTPGDWGELTVLDARTGATRWRAPTFSQARVAGDRVAYVVEAQGDGPRRLVVADLVTGRRVWSAAAEVYAMHVADDYVITVDSEYRATVRAAADGRVLVRDRDLQPDWEVWEDSWSVPAGDRLYLIGGSFVAAVRAADLTVLWRTPTRVPLTAQDCGDAVCVNGEAPAWVTVLDRRTGKVRWTARGWRTITPDGYVTADGVHAARVDMATGRVVRDLGRAVLAGDLVLRSDRSRTWVTRLGDGRVVGPLPFFAPAGCARLRPYLACPTDGQPVTVWRTDEPEAPR
jgi:outer membrane protein assembly factor BamB